MLADGNTARPADLARALTKVAADYFDGAINASADWGVPPVTVAYHADQPPILGVDAIDVAGVAVAVAASNYPAVKQMLGPQADAGNRDAAALLCSAAKQNGSQDAAHWNALLLSHAQSITTVPASCYIGHPEINRGHGEILIHPFIRDAKAPELVLTYLLYHECVHQLVPCDGDNQHPEAFLRYERRAPQRRQAMRWLKKNGFPVLLIEGDVAAAGHPGAGGAR